MVSAKLRQAVWRARQVRMYKSARKKRKFLRFIRANDPKMYRMVKRLLTDPAFYASVKRRLVADRRKRRRRRRAAKMAGFTSYGAELFEILG